MDKNYLKKLLFGVGIIVMSIEIQAQSNLNQVELNKQFIGTWKCEYAKDTFLVIKNNPFGANGMVSVSRIFTKSETLDSIIQLYAYEKNYDRFIMSELVRSSSTLEICYMRFTTNTTGEIIVTNTDNAKFEWRFEFKSPDLIVQQALFDGKVVKEVSVNRVE